MNRSTTLLLAALFQFLAMLFPAAAEHIYIAQNARGANTGADAGNAHGYTWFNDSINWSAIAANDGKIGPGDTVHLTGTINNQLTIEGSGTPSNRITIKFDPGAKMSAPSWTGTGAIWGSEVANITIEGGNSGPVKSTFTQIDMEATQNGTALPLQVDDSRFIYIENAGSNITIRNLWMTNLYVRTYQHPSDRHATASAISLRGQDDLVIENCAIFHAETGLTITGNGDLNERLIIRDSLISDCSNGIKMGVAGENHVNKDCQIIRNRIDHMARWGGIETNGFHADGIQTITVAKGSRQENLTVAYNHIGPNVGRPGDLTALIFLEDFINGCKVYNNLLEYAPGHQSSNPCILAGTYIGFIGTLFGLQSYIVNNTIIGNGTLSAAIGTAFAVVQGNVATGMHSYISAYRQPGTELTIDRNVFFGASDDEFGVVGNEQGIYRIPKWQSFGYDVHSVFADPKLNANGTLQSGSPAIGLAPVQSIFTNDFNGNPRTGTWDAGAFEFGGPSSGGGGGVVPTPTPGPVSTPTPPPSGSPTPAPPPTSSTPMPAPASGGLVAAFGFNESSGTTALDASGNANTGAITRATRTPGKFGSALNFDGISSLVKINGSASLNVSSAMTLEAWVKPTANQSGWRNILQRERVAYFLHAGHDQGALRPATGGTFNRANNFFAAPPANALPVNTWTHVASTYDGTTLRLYVNGSPAGERAVTGSIETNSSPLWIGGNEPFGEFFQGQIDEVRIYNRALSQAEILADRDRPVGSSGGGILPSPSPVSDLPTIDEPIAADSVPPSAPFIATNGYVSQPSQTSLSAGGRAVYKFTVPEHGEYAVIFVVDTYTGNSLYLNVDADPEDPVMIWDVAVTQGFETRVASWRGGGSAGSNQFSPKYFLLSPGQHQLIIRGREANTRFKTITIVKRPAPPNDLVIP